MKVNRVLPGKCRMCMAAAMLALGLLAAGPARAAQNSAGDELVLVSASASYLGVDICDISNDSAHGRSLGGRSGVEVTAVDHDAPAGKAGLHLRDVITAVDGRPMASAQQFRETMRGIPPNRQVELAVMREGKAMTFRVRLADRAKLQQQAWEQHFDPQPPEVARSFGSVVMRSQGAGNAQGDVEEPGGSYRIGAVLSGMTTQLAVYFGIKDGTGMLVAAIDPGGPASSSGLQVGDVVLRLNGERIMGPIDWMRAMQAAQGKPVQITVMRNKRVETITVVPFRTQADWFVPRRWIEAERSFS